MAGATVSGTIPGRPASTPMPLQDWGAAAAIVTGWANRIWRTCEGLELMLATPIMPLAKLASVAVAVAVVEPSLTPHVIWLPMTVAVMV